MASIASQEYRLLPIGDLCPHPDNPHRGDAEVIAESIDTNGFYGAVLVQKSRMRIIAGEHRWLGAKARGLAEVPAVVVDVDDETATRIMLADNRTAEHGGYDDGKLVELLQALPDLDGTGWREEDLADLLNDLDGDIEVIADEVPDRLPGKPAPAPAEDETDAADDEVEDDDLDEDQEPSPDAPRPKSGMTVDLIVSLTAAEHDEVTELLAAIRDRDGAAPLPQLVVAALRSLAGR